MRIKNIFSFGTIIVNTVRKFLNGKNIIAEFKDIEGRIGICRTCEHKVGDSLEKMKCNLCECKIRYKVRFVSSYCPDGRWHSTDFIQKNQ